MIGFLNTVGKKMFISVTLRSLPFTVYIQKMDVEPPSLGNAGLTPGILTAAILVFLKLDLFLPGCLLLLLLLLFGLFFS